MENLIPLIVLIAIVCGICRFVRLSSGKIQSQYNPSEDELICKACGTAGYFSKGKKGHGAIEIALYLCYLVPGIIYSVWRRSGVKPACEACGSQDVIPIASPIGKKIAKR